MQTKVLFIFVTLFLAVSTFLTGCNSAINADNLELVNGIYMDKLENSPYTGPFERYYPNGKIMEKGNLEFGRLDGEYTKWSKDGYITEISTYKYGKKVK